MFVDASGTRRDVAGASVKALEESVGDLVARLNSYNAYLPKQARWQAEPMLSDLARDPQVSGAMSSAAAASSALEQTSASMERMPEILGQARTAVLADVDGQRLATQTFLRQERLETLDTIKQERIATLSQRCAPSVWKRRQISG